MTTPRVGQFSLVAPLLAGPPPMRAGQLAFVTPLLAIPPPVRMGGLAMITVIGNAKGFYALGQSIGLQCWQPCTAFGTQGSVHYVNG